MPFFSVVIPLYNKARFIARTLESVLAQTFVDFEVLVINDGSTDDSEAIVQSFNDPRIQYYLRENKGVAAARNFGITLASGDFIAFLDADDFWYPDFLQTMYRNIQRFPNESVFTSAIEIETARNLFPAQYVIERTGLCEVVDFFDASGKEAVIWTSSSVFKKSVFETAGIFDPNVKFAEDTDLWIRIGLQYKVVFDWKVLARYGFDPVSFSRGGNYFLEQSTFAKYAALEPSNARLKKYLDLNRFSVAIKAKLAGDSKTFKQCYEAIDLANLNVKKRVLLHLTRFQLQVLVRLRTWMAENGLSRSIFK